MLSSAATSLRQRPRVGYVSRLYSSGLFDSILGKVRATDIPKTESIDVCFVDPKLVLDQAENKNKSQIQRINLSIPYSFLVELSKGYQAALMVENVQTGGLLSSVVLQGVNELGDTDDPMNNWYFGKAGEIFQYQLIGTHSTASGFTSVIAKHVLDEILAGDVRNVPKWSEFLQLFNDDKLAWPSRRTPFLFAGRLIDTGDAAVYVLRENDALLGVMVSSKAFDE